MADLPFNWGDVLIVGGNLLCLIVLAMAALVILRGRPAKYPSQIRPPSDG